MSKNKGFSSTSANRYSLALYELASEASLLAQIEKNSSAFLTLISSNQDFRNFVKDPTLDKEVLTNVINKLSEVYKIESLFKNFVSFLITRRRFFYVEQILRSFIEICSEKRGELKAEIKSAKQLTQDIGVASIPVSGFCKEAFDYQLLRFCFAKDDITLEEAAARLCQL